MKVKKELRILISIITCVLTITLVVVSLYVVNYKTPNGFAFVLVLSIAFVMSVFLWLVIDEKYNKVDLFDPVFLESQGFKVVKDDGQYGSAVDIRTNGITVLEWNRKGPSVTYFGDKVAPGASYFGILKDGGTRKAFSGYIRHRSDITMLLNMTW